jgi:hypothetical protein
MGDEVAQDYVKGLLSTGEVVLIDTRQHWMALVRFALKPILLMGLVVLLILVNQWLDFGDGILGILNELIHIILVVAIMVSVVWLPVDVVRWRSRHFVLTNRRAMRLDGMFRKRSFDSSLEQINDISFTQSVLGRSMGYADLTILTASGAANESYEQLMDGLQFKKAVLDAKEAIRLESPLQELTEGFIVKGGTNLASLRADGKLEEAAVAEGTGPLEPVTAEALAQRSDPGRVETPGAEDADALTASEAAGDEPEAATAEAPDYDAAWPVADQAATDADADTGADTKPDADASTDVDAEPDTDASTDEDADAEKAEAEADEGPDAQEGGGHRSF